MAAKLVNKREPLICLKPFKFLRRQYSVGDIIDRRRVKMLHRKMVKLIDNGNIELCCDMAEEDLEELGYSYDIKNGRYPLVKLIDKVRTPEKVEGEVLEEGEGNCAGAEENTKECDWIPSEHSVNKKAKDLPDLQKDKK